MTFTLADQLAFAELSGDWNPLHVDPVAARRLVFGEVGVHGVHLVAWALDRWLAEAEGQVRITRIRASFWKPVGLDRRVSWHAAGAEGEVELTVRVGELAATTIRVAFAPGAARDAPDGAQPRGSPQVRTPDAIRDAAGEVAVAVDHRAAAARFPALTRRAGTGPLAVLTAATRVVGMSCPGLHSVFSALDLELGEGTTLGWRATSWRPALGAVSLAIEGAGRGTLSAFVRPEPRPQAPYAEVRGRVAPGAFAGERALVVGGSRGAGEVTAKLLAAGGADVVLTWASGEADAARVVAEITAGGGQARAARLDVRAPAALDPAISHLYYFATPPLGAAEAGVFQPALFAGFIEVYVLGFERVFRALHAQSPLAGVFWPSTVAVEELPPGMGEYAVAKAAGEALCELLARTTGVRVFRPRLPRLDTDLTASVRAVRTSPVVPLMAELLAAFHA